jgi:hypothetical protein
MFLIRLNLQNYIYEYLLFNNLRNTRLVPDVLFNTICYTTTNISVWNAQLKSFKLITQILKNPTVSHQSYTIASCGLKQVGMTVPFVM